MQIDSHVIESAIAGVGLEEDVDIEIRSDYSGRYMYGEKCLAVVCDAGQFALLCASLGSFSDDWDWVGAVRMDEMGRSIVWYWPGVQVVEAGSRR